MKKAKGRRLKCWLGGFVLLVLLIVILVFSVRAIYKNYSASTVGKREQFKEQLQEKFNDEDPKMRLSAIEYVLDLTDKKETDPAKVNLAIKQLVDSLYDKDEEVSTEAEEALKKIGKRAATFLIEEMKDCDEGMFKKITSILAEIKPVSDLAELLKSEDDEVRLRARNVLIKIGREAKSVLEELRDTGSPGEAIEARYILQRIDKQDCEESEDGNRKNKEEEPSAPRDG